MTSDAATDKAKILGWEGAMTQIGVKTAANTPMSLVAPFDFDRLVAAIERCAVALETLASDVKPPAATPLEAFKPTESYPKNGLHCSVCGYPQHETPGGACCANGHGGARGVPVWPEAKEIGQRLAEQAAQYKASAAGLRGPTPAGVAAATLAAPDDPQREGVPGTPAAEPGPTAQPTAAVVTPSAATPPTASSWADEAAALEEKFAECEAAKRVLGDDLYHAVWATPLLDRVELGAAVALRDRAITVLGSREAFERARDASGVASGKLPTGEHARRIVLEHVVPAAERGGAK